MLWNTGENKKRMVKFPKIGTTHWGGGGEGRRGGGPPPLLAPFMKNCWPKSRAVSLTWVGLPTYKPTAHCLGLAFLLTKLGSTTLASKPYRYLLTQPNMTTVNNSYLNVVQYVSDAATVFVIVWCKKAALSIVAKYPFGSFLILQIGERHHRVRNKGLKVTFAFLHHAERRSRRQQCFL